MMTKNILQSFILLIGLILFSATCDNSTDPTPAPGNIGGTVSQITSTGEIVISPAYIFSDNKLLTTTDQTGNYSIQSLDEGTYKLTCSSLYFRDTTMSVTVKGGKTVTQDFHLTPDSTLAEVYGEFEDMTLYNDVIKIDPLIKDWSAEDVFSQVTGATLQSKWLMQELPDRIISLNDDVVAYCDGFGQFFFRMQIGTYPITGSCEGYNDNIQVLKVVPNTKNYVNFFLERQ
ncbi:carboxypeptidase-like regulatory domain-containing protein [candidate division KSB1 bacterium]|nr:carboxypeptidase-like regulatory domain-containing protein [candidate division KSB1 bacterium]